MARIIGLDNPLLLGFDNLERMIEKITRTAGNEGFPPYNIEQIGPHELRITLAVAGFSMQDLSVATEDNQLVIRGQQENDAKEERRVYLYRGIAARQFQRRFMLADDLEIKGASLNNGLLHIHLERHIPDPIVRTIPIHDEQKADAGADSGTDIAIDDKTRP